MAGELVEAGSTAVVGAMGTDAWQTTRASVARLFGRGRPNRQARYEAQLDDNAAQVAGANDPDRVREGLVPVWRLELQGLLRRHPDAENELRALVQRVADALPAAQQDWVHTHLSRPPEEH